jgi:hypothetical protein
MRTKTMTRTIIGAGALSLLAAAPALAARPSGPSGEIYLMQPPPPSAALSTLGETPPPDDETLEVTYGEFADFDTSLEGKVSAKSSVYVKVLCSQDGSGVYHQDGLRDTSFLMQSQGGKFNWTGQEADCEANLLYRVDKGKSSQFTLLDSEQFTVVP